jgi:hypothetical protein
VHYWFTVGDGNHRRAAFVHGLEAFFGRQFLFQNMGWILDFPATGAGQIAAEERFEHQDKGIALPSLKFLFQDGGGYRPHLGIWYWYRCAYSVSCVINSFHHY